jgi:predicted Zn-dependent peptidase
MDVAQGKLAMGFRTAGINARSENYPALMVFNAVYGGTTTSKLFMNVREKLSLCYFASSSLEKLKGVMLVSSGIEFDKYEQAKDEILAQLEACRRGEVEQWELVGAVRSIVSALQTTLDSQGRLEDYWLGQAVAGLKEGPEELAARVEQVTLKDVVEIAHQVKLDTIYFLKGKEG